LYFVCIQCVVKLVEDARRNFRKLQMMEFIAMKSLSNFLRPFRRRKPTEDGRGAWAIASLVFALIVALGFAMVPASRAVVYQSCGGDPGGCTDPNGCTKNCDNNPSGCSSPIIIDTEGEGFHLTSAATGVTFDISGTGKPIQIAWTDARFHNAFLALPATDGLVHNGKELFGNFTPQPQSSHPNGFLALAEYDRPENGGNGDGIIDERDQVFSQLRLWIDENHDGICQPQELHTLQELGFFSISLKYRESRRTDRYGNQFRYRGRINVTDQQEDGSPADPTVYDVFFTEINRS
jgi:hypothetical protein